MNKEQIKYVESILKSKEVKIQGIKIDLTEEQLQKLQQLVEHKHPFKRVDKGETYYFVEPYVDGVFYSLILTETYNDLCDKKFDSGNYYNNKEFADQVAMDLNLQQRLRKFTYENGWSDDLWEDTNVYKTEITFDGITKRWGFRTYKYPMYNPLVVYFKNGETAHRAVEEVVRPFCKENPNYRFQEE